MIRGGDDWCKVLLVLTFVLCAVYVVMVDRAY